METEFDDGSGDDLDGIEDELRKRPGMPQVPDRGRVVIVNFEMGGRAVGKEFGKPGRPCVVLQNNKLRRGPLVTVVPLSCQEPDPRMPYHHLLDHRSFAVMPAAYGPSDRPRWAKCDHLYTVSLERCLDPYRKRRDGPRQYVKVKVIKADIDAIERCVLWALGVNRPDPAAPAA